MSKPKIDLSGFRLPKPYRPECPVCRGRGGYVVGKGQDSEWYLCAGEDCSNGYLPADPPFHARLSRRYQGYRYHWQTA